MFGVPILYKPTPPLRARRIGGRDVPGSLPYEFGRIARYPGADWIPRTMLAGQRKAEHLNRRDKGMNVEAVRQVRKMEFEETTDRKALVGRMRRGVECGLKAYDLEVGRRRIKLRNLILEEEGAWTQEYIEKCQRAEDNKMDEYRQQAERLKAKKEADRLALADEKRFQQYRERNEELRLLEGQRKLVESKQAQMYQIKEKEWIRQQEAEEERMWAAVHRKNVQALKEREEEDALRQKMRDIDMIETLNLQREGMRKLEEDKARLREEEIKFNEESMARLKLELEMEDLDKRRKNAETRAALLKQLGKQKELKEEKKKQEAAWDKVMHAMVEDELRRLRAAQLDFTETAKRESAMYHKSVREIKEAEKVIQREQERIILEEREKIQAKKDKVRQQVKEARHKLAQDVLAERAHQVAMQQVEAHLLKQREEADKLVTKQLWAQNVRLRELHDQQRAQARRLYQDELLQQATYNKLRQERVEEEDRQRECRIRLDEERSHRMMKQLLETPLARKVHSFKVALEGHVARPPVLPQPPAAREAFPCPKLAGDEPLPTAVPDRSLAITPAADEQKPATPPTEPVKSSDVEKSLPVTAQLGEHRDGLTTTTPVTPFPTAPNIHAPTAQVITLPCPAFPAPSDTRPIKTEVPSHMKQIDYAST